MAFIFVSYSRTDQAFVKRLVNDLRAHGVNVWLDQDSIAPGQRWDMAIERALEAATHILFVMSQSSTQSENVRDELDTAIDSGKIILPVLIDDCKPPLRTRRMQYTDFREDYAAGLDSLIAMLSDRAGNAPNTEVPTVQRPQPPDRVSAARSTGSKTLAVVASLILIAIIGVAAFVATRGPQQIANLTTPTNTASLTATRSPEATRTEIAPTATVTRITPSPGLTTTASPGVTTAASATVKVPPTATPILIVGGSCPDALPSRLAPKSRGRVIPGGDPNNVRAEPKQSAAWVTQIIPGEAFDILAGPHCSDSMWWWQVRYKGQEGWTAEGNHLYYWLEPLDVFDTFLTNLPGWHPVRGADGAPSSWQDGKFVASEGIFGARSSDNAFYLSADSGKDFSYEGDISLHKPPSEAGMAGLAFRMGSDPLSSGYVASITATGGGQVKLISLPSTELAAYKTPIKADETHHLKVVVAGSSIKVYLDGDLAPIIDVSDTTYTEGYFGLNVYQSGALFQNIFRHDLN
jgi:TIR domain/Bacterial SH3 domain